MTAAVLVFLAGVLGPCSGGGKSVEDTFSYPEASDQERVRPVVAKRLAGRVVYGDEDPLADALVEVIDAKGRRLAAVLTGEDGTFCFTSEPPRKVTLRISLPQFTTTIVPFVLSSRADKDDAVIHVRFSR